MMKKVSLILFTIVAMFSFSGCTTKFAYNNDYTKNLFAKNKIMNENETINVCYTDDSSKYAFSSGIHLGNIKDSFIFPDNVAQSILSEYLKQFYTNVGAIKCNRDNISEGNLTGKTITAYVTDTDMGAFGFPYTTYFTLLVNNNGKISSLNIKGEPVYGPETRSVDLSSYFAIDGIAFSIAYQRSLVHGLQKEETIKSLSSLLK